MNDSKESLENEQIEQFIKFSKKAKTILEYLAWKYVDELEIRCNHIRVDIIDMSSITIFFINKSVMGDKDVSIINIPYEALFNPVEWFQKQSEQTKKFQQEVADRIKKRNTIQKQAKKEL